MSGPVRHARSLVGFVLVAALLVGFEPSARASIQGSRLWVSRYQGPAQGSDEARKIVVSPDGTKLFVAGSSDTPHGAADIATAAYDPSTGATLWVKLWDGPGHYVDSAQDVAVSNDGSKVFVTGYTFTESNTGIDYATVAYDSSTGTQLWVALYDGSGANATDSATAIASSADGGMVFVTGYSNGGGSGNDYATVAYDADSGAQVWVTRYTSPGSNQDIPTAVAATMDGATLFVTGAAAGSGASDYVTVAYDAVTGVELWVQDYDGGVGINGANGLVTGLGGAAVFVTGYSFGFGTDYDYATVAYDAATGARLWVARFDHGGTFGVAVAEAASPDGARIYVTGYVAAGHPHTQYATVAYDAASGSQLWARQQGNPGNRQDIATAIAANPNGTAVYVTGWSFLRSSRDYITMAYRATDGARLWLRRYDGPSNGIDVAASVATSPDGTQAFVTGSSERAPFDDDWATVAYAV